MCGGRGQVRARQGFFVVEQTCPTCRGVGEVIADPCPTCRGEGRVEKRKSLDGQHPRRASTKAPASASPARARPGVRGGPPGDLYIFIHLARHADLPARGHHPVRALPGQLHHRRAGRHASRCPASTGRCTRSSIPAGIQSGKQLRQRGAGMPAMDGRGHGDMVIQIEVETPTKLSAKQRELLEQFRETETGEECPASKGFFQKLKSAWEGLKD